MKNWIKLITIQVSLLIAILNWFYLLKFNLIITYKLK